MQSHAHCCSASIQRTRHANLSSVSRRAFRRRTYRIDDVRVRGREPTIGAWTPRRRDPGHRGKSNSRMRAARYPRSDRDTQMRATSCRSRKRDVVTAARRASSPKTDRFRCEIEPKWRYGVNGGQSSRPCGCGLQPPQYSAAQAQFWNRNGHKSGVALTIIGSETVDRGRYGSDPRAPA
jgi:hypothetical protein